MLCLTPFSLQAGNYTPLMIAELFRHGARTPFNNLLNLDFFDKFGGSNLIPTGERQHFLLGSYIRQTYPDLFKNYNATQPILES